MYNVQSELLLVDEELRRCPIQGDMQYNLQNKKIEILLSSLVSSNNECRILPPELTGKYKLIKYQGKRITLANAIRMYNLGVTPDELLGNTYRTCNNAECFNPAHLVSSKELRYMQLSGMATDRPQVMQNRGTNSNRIQLSEEEELARQEREINEQYAPRELEPEVSNKVFDPSMWNSLTEEEIEKQRREEEAAFLIASKTI